jgi:DNA-binding IclR family transcriptional regulator
LVHLLTDLSGWRYLFQITDTKSDNRNEEMTPTTRAKAPTGAEFSLSVSRALDILSSFTVDRSELGLAEISRTMALSKGSVSRFLQALEMHGYIDRDPRSRLYRPGPEAARVGSLYHSAGRMREFAMPIMRALVQRVGVTSYLSELRDDQMLILVAVEGPGPIRYTIPVGTRLPLSNTATGLVALSQMSEGELDRTIKNIMAKPSAGNNRLTRPTLLKRLADVRSNGYSTNWELSTPGVGSLAAPVAATDGSALCVLSVGFATSQIKKDQLEVLGRDLKKAANQLAKVFAEKGIDRVE